MVKNLNRILILVLLIVSVVGCKSSYRFTKNQKSLIKMGDSATPMRVLKITNSSDSILLRTKSSKIKIDPNDEILKTFINRLYSTVRDSMSLGVGIAAPQVGVLKKIIWVQRFDKEKFPFEVYLNPEIVKYSYKTQPCLAGCLSIPKRRDTTYTRSETIMIEYDQFNKNRTREKISGFTAVIFQHEIDHLNGILYLDHLEKEKNQQEN